MIAPTRNVRGDVMGIQPVVNFLPGRFGECHLHPAHDVFHDIGVDVLEIVLGRLYDIEFINPALVFSRGVGLATRHASREASGVPRRVKVERRRQRQLSSPPMGGLWEYGP